MAVAEGANLTHVRVHSYRFVYTHKSPQNQNALDRLSHIIQEMRTGEYT